MDLPAIDIRNFTYELPEEKIASHPLEQRDSSRLLVFKDRHIDHRIFSQLSDFLTDKTTLFFNNTKVIPARFFFNKPSGALIEVFLLSPVQPASLATALGSTRITTWKCTIGNLKKWPNDLVLSKQLDNVIVSAELTERRTGMVRFTWDNPEVTFAQIVHMIGAIPLPPYIKRSADTSDAERYQTVYSDIEGAVAAPTAGLHFTPEVLKSLEKKGILIDNLTLHVSAGTFMPVKAVNAVDHDMHWEEVIITEENIRKLLLKDRTAIAVGTTAVRTIESIYWYGVKLMKDAASPFVIEKLDPYQLPGQPVDAALHAIREKMTREGLTELTGRTSIFIFPGYTFRLVKGLITNFHQPGSTLLLLIAALVGNDWKKIYDEALANNYRFLSYGDSSLLFP